MATPMNRARISLLRAALAVVAVAVLVASLGARPPVSFLRPEPRLLLSVWTRQPGVARCRRWSCW